MSEAVATQPSIDPRIGTTIAGYRIERLLGRGGMSTVYLAEDLALGRNVALKLLSAELSEDEAFRERFRLESRLAASIDHPHVIPIYEAGQADDRTLFIVMRYVDGADLKQILTSDGALDPQRAVELLTQAARGLDAAHARGLVHRDVKPSNVLVATREAEGEHVYLADFGLTKSSASREAARESILLSGSIDYLSPEQIEGTSADHASDIYALGCVAFECLTGEVPFPRPSETAVLFAHMEDEPPRPTSLNHALPAAVDTVTEKAMAKPASERYRSGAEFAESLREAITSSARRRRSRRTVLAVALAAIIAVAAGVPAVLLTGDDGAFARTGDAWSQAPPEEGVFGGPGSVMAQTVAASADVLVAAGWDDSGPDRNAAVWTSPEGDAWTRVRLNEQALGGGGDQEINAVATSESGFVAVGSESFGVTGDIRAVGWTSSDGISWARVPLDDADLGAKGPVEASDELFYSRHTMADVAPGGPGFVAVGDEYLWFGIVNADRRGAEWSAAVWTSVDGTSWSRIRDQQPVFANQQGADMGMLAVTQGNGRLVAVGFESDSDRALNAAVWTSEDGLEWMRVPHNEALGSDATFVQMNDVVARGRGFVAVGAEFPEDAAREINQVGLLTSETVLTVGASLKGGPTAAIWVSADGLEWERVPQERLVGAGDEERALVAVGTGGPGLIAVGWRLVDGELDAEVWISSDGSEWALARDTDGAFSAPDRQLITDVIAGGPGLLAVGASGSLLDFRAAVWSSP